MSVRRWRHLKRGVPLVHATIRSAFGEWFQAGEVEIRGLASLLLRFPSHRGITQRRSRALCPEKGGIDLEGVWGQVTAPCSLRRW